MSISEDILYHFGTFYCDVMRGIAQFISDIPTVYWFPVAFVSGTLTLTAVVYVVIGLFGRRHA